MSLTSRASQAWRRAVPAGRRHYKAPTLRCHWERASPTIASKNLPRIRFARLASHPHQRIMGPRSARKPSSRRVVPDSRHVCTHRAGGRFSESTPRVPATQRSPANHQHGVTTIVGWCVPTVSQTSLETRSACSRSRCGFVFEVEGRVAGCLERAPGGDREGGNRTPLNPRPRHAPVPRCG